jgi:hypothetical protein
MRQMYLRGLDQGEAMVALIEVNSDMHLPWEPQETQTTVQLLDSLYISYPPVSWNYPAAA